MSLIQGIPGYVSATSGFTAGANIIGTRLKGPALSGQVADNGVGGPLYQAGGYICIQSTASLTNQVVTTSATTVNNRASFVYIPVSTATLQGAGAPPYVGVGVPLVWNDASKRLEIWSSGAAEWLTMSSSGTFSSS